MTPQRNSKPRVWKCVRNEGILAGTHGERALEKRKRK